MTKSKQVFLDKYKDPRWQKRRLEILEMDNFTCQMCESTEKTLHVHHQYYEYGKDPWDYPHKSLWTFCEDCHKKAESSRKDLKELVAKAQQEVVTEFEAREEALRKETVEAHKIAQDAKTAQQAAEKTLAEYRVRFASIANQLKQARNGRIGVRKPLFKKVKKG